MKIPFSTLFFEQGYLSNQSRKIMKFSGLALHVIVEGSVSQFFLFKS